MADEVAASGLAHCRKDFDLLHPVGKCPYDVAAVTEARREGRAAALREVADAYRLFIATDDLDGFRDTLTDLMDAAGLLDEYGADRSGGVGPRHA